MFEKDWNIINNSLNTFQDRHSFDEGNNFVNPYSNKSCAQKKCRHMWENDTDATYYTKGHKRKCAICGKEF